MDAELRISPSAVAFNRMFGEPMTDGGKTVEGVRIMITQAGRGALNDEGETGVRSD